MRRWILVLTMLILWLVPFPVRAQGDIKYDSVLVQLWPEFDKPEMLVMVELTLPPDTPFPLDLTYRIPSGAIINTIAIGRTRESVTDQGIVYETQQNGNVNEILIKKVNGPSLRIEYYDQLEYQDATRRYNFQWLGDLATGSLSIIFQVPVDATGIVLDPSPVGSTTDANGLVYYRVEFQSLQKNETASFKAEYQKTTDRLSASLQDVQPASSLGSETKGQVSLSTYLPWLVGAAGLLLIVVGLGIGLSYWRGKGRKRPEPRQRHSVARSKKTGMTPLNCPECGHRVQPGDQFCRACGQRVVSED